MTVLQIFVDEWVSISVSRLNLNDKTIGATVHIYVAGHQGHSVKSCHPLTGTGEIHGEANSTDGLDYNDTFRKTFGVMTAVCGPGKMG